MSPYSRIGIKRNIPPEYDHNKPPSENFEPFFDWAISLRNPMRQIPELGDRLAFGVRRHPLGFVAVYLSQRDRGLATPHLAGIARANIYPPGDPIKEDPHCHGFDFMSGTADGLLLNTWHFPDFSTRLPDGEGYIGYETHVNHLGENISVQATDAVISVPRSELQELLPGQTYSMRARQDFHSVAAGEEGAVTIFCKTPTQPGSDGYSLVLKRPTDAPPPAAY